MKTKITIVLLSIFFLVGHGLAQDFKTDLKKASLAYMQSENIDSEFEVVNYFREQDMKPEKSTYRLKKRGGSYRYDIGGIKTIIGDGYTIIHHAEKAILACNKNSGATAIKKLNVVDIDKMTNNYKEIIYKGIIKGKKLYVLKNSKLIFSTVEIYLNATTGLVEKTVQHYNESLESKMLKVETITRKMDLQPTFSKDTFSIKKYVKISSTQEVKLQPAYAQNQLIVGHGLK